MLSAGTSASRSGAVADVIERIPGLRAVNAGALEQARFVEALTPLLISVNTRNKATPGSAHRAGRAAVVAVLAGGTGGAKLARGMLDVVGGGELVVIANTGDDLEIYGAHVSPDPDLIAYSLADALDARGYGIARRHLGGDGRAGAAGRDTWFRLGDRDLAMCLLRTELLRAARASPRPTPRSWRGAGRRARRVLPMSDEPVRTQVRATGGAVLPGVHDPRPRGRPIEAVELAGSRQAQPAPDVLDAIAAAEAIVIGPSNPVISIGPILAVPGMREALAARARRSSP